MDRNLDGDDSASGIADERLHYHQDALYSVYAVTDENGQILESYLYDPYGKVTVFDKNGIQVADNAWGTANSAIGNPYLFTGRRFDEETGLYYYRNRYFNSDQGRFITRWGNLAADVNLYQYQFSQPTMLVDPYGDPNNGDGDPPPPPLPPWEQSQDPFRKELEELARKIGRDLASVYREADILLQRSAISQDYCPECPEKLSKLGKKGFEKIGKSLLNFGYSKIPSEARPIVGGLGFGVGALLGLTNEVKLKKQFKLGDSKVIPEAKIRKKIFFEADLGLEIKRGDFKVKVELEGCNVEDISVSVKKTWSYGGEGGAKPRRITLSGTTKYDQQGEKPRWEWKLGATLNW